MPTETFIEITYLVATVLFILSLKWLSSPTTARHGVWAGEIGMLDAISGGRLDVGFARAFLPHEFRRFGRSPDESVARFREGID